jgi:opacity protein-like surface antigen
MAKRTHYTPLEERMVRPSSVVPSVCAGLALWLAAAPVEAQLQEVSYKRFEITPFAGYQWGGSFDTQGSATVPAGTLRLKDSFAWGAILSVLASAGSAVELTYLRQDTDIEFDSLVGGNRDLGGFAVNYIQIGGRQEFGRGGPLRPFINGSLGIGIFDPKEGDLGSSTRFSWSIGGGAKYMFASETAGIRTDIRLWGTPVPSGEIGVWCGFYACVAAEGTEWVTQGQLTGGIVLLF